MTLESDQSITLSQAAKDYIMNMQVDATLNLDSFEAAASTTEPFVLPSGFLQKESPEQLQTEPMPTNQEDQMVILQHDTNTPFSTVSGTSGFCSFKSFTL